MCFMGYWLRMAIEEYGWLLRVGEVLVPSLRVDRTFLNLLFVVGAFVS